MIGVTQSATIHASEGRSFHIDQRFREKKSPLSFAAFIDQVREKVPPGRS